MLRHLMLLVLVACSTRAERPAPGAALGFVPAAIADRLAGANIVFAVNVEQSDPTAFLSQLPPDLACVRDLVRSVGVAVLVIRGADVSTAAAYATGLPGRATRACLDQVMPALGGSTRTGADGTYEVHLADIEISLSWKDGIVTARPLGAPAIFRGAPGPPMRALIGQVPAHAKVVFLAMAFPERKIKNLIGWAHIAEDVAHLTVRAEGDEPGVVQPWLQGLIDGFNNAAAAKQIPVDHRWFEGTLAEPVGTIEGRIPISIFRDGLIPAP